MFDALPWESPSDDEPKPVETVARSTLEKVCEGLAALSDGELPSERPPRAWSSSVAWWVVDLLVRARKRLREGWGPESIGSGTARWGRRA